MLQDIERQLWYIP